MAEQEQKEIELPVSEEVSLLQMSEGPEKNHFLEPFILLAKHKFFILYFVVGAAVLSVAVSLLLPVYYTANAKILPPQQSQSISSAMLNQLGQFGPLAGLAGQGLGVRNASDLYVAMLRSRTVADRMIDRFSLMNVYHKMVHMDARRRLENLTEISAGKDGIISVSVDDRSPTRAAEMANAYIDELEKLTRTLAVTDAGKRRLFFEREVKTANEELVVAELSLKQTEESTGIIQLDSQSKVMLQAYADLRAQVGIKEVQVQSMRSFATPENPDLIRAEQELSALHAQLRRFERGQGGRSVADIALEKVPGAGLEYIRKLREVKYRETLFELLAKQYEAARIDEAKDASVIQELDKAVPPEKKSWPLRAVIVVVVTILALLLAILVVFAMEALEEAKKDAQFATRLRLFQSYLRVGHKS
ncbi:MAG TPA: Wzz/FepE/Etk N-terminal domain-containing protein [Candidatus Acidoferrum sp.]|nr:Wzz/FepE/Etk N-terminal domain-containing protein [Candidatus Acidoferrum sp.]